MQNKEYERHLLSRAIATGITDPRELANFMGQMHVESGGFSRLSEDMHYSGKRLFQLFRGRNGIDTLEAAEAISSRGPEAVANAIYGGSWGNENLKNSEPEDGWRYRGRGFIQLTGRANYVLAARDTGIDLVAHPDLAAEPETAAIIAVKYWEREVVSRGHQFDVDAATVDINGGRNGIEERRRAVAQWAARFERQSPQEMLAAAGIDRDPDPLARRPDSDPAAALNPRGLERGRMGTDVHALQSLLDHLGYRDGDGRRLRADGDFGRRTEEAVKAFQAAHGLETVGRVGPRTEAALRHAREHGAAPVDPAHPDHALYRQVSRAVDAMEHVLGRVPDDASARLKAVLLPAAKQAGLARVDAVALSAASGTAPAGERVFAVQGRLDDPEHRRAQVSTQQAIATPVQDAWEALERLNVQARQQARSPGLAHAGHALPSDDSERDAQPIRLADATQRAHQEHQDGLRRGIAP